LKSNPFDGELLADAAEVTTPLSNVGSKMAGTPTSYTDNASLGPLPVPPS
jgi:hypothetical protein